jgi:RNA polymerase sigma factor (sigma-70 family)
VTPTDDELVRHATDGQRQALVQLLERHGPQVWHRLAPQIPARWQTILSREDLMQEVYINAILGIGQLSGRTQRAFAGWLACIARNTLLDALRTLEAQKRGGERRPVEIKAAGDSFVALYEVLGATSSTASRHAARQEARSALEQAMEQLPPAYRDVVRWYDLERRSIDEIATALRRSSKAVFMIRSRAHERLRCLLGSASRFLSDCG